MNLELLGHNKILNINQLGNKLMQFKMVMLVQIWMKYFVLMAYVLVLVLCVGKMVINIKVDGLMVNLMVKVCICGIKKMV